MYLVERPEVFFSTAHMHVLRGALSKDIAVLAGHPTLHRTDGMFWPARR